MVRRCLVSFKPFRIFMFGIGVFSLFLFITSLGGQLLTKKMAEYPFTIRNEVLGSAESRGVLRRICDMLETIMKRIDTLSRMDNASDLKRLEELSLAISRFQPASLMEKIQAIAQNMSSMAAKVDQILQNREAISRAKYGTVNQCEVPKDPRYPECPNKVDWMRARWTSDPCYAFYGVDGTDCSFVTYLSEVEWFCPPLPWRNHTISSTHKPKEKRQAAFRTDLTALLEQMSTGKESLKFMKRRIHHLARQWAQAANRLAQRLKDKWREQKLVLVHVGFLTEESGDEFSPRVLKGGPLGEMVQWADILTSLYVLGHSLKVSFSVKELQGFLGVPPGRGSCPLTGPLPFDLIYTDYLGLQQMKQNMGLSLKKHRCRIRVIDTFGTEPAYNHEEYATLHGFRTNWGYWNLNPKQYMTMFPHTPDNSFMGFVTEELNETEKEETERGKQHRMAVAYGKEVSMWKGKEKFLEILHRHMEIHSTVYYEQQRPQEIPAFIKNHGILPQLQLQQLLRKAKLFVGMGFPYEGPAPLEAIANGCIFLQPGFNPPHSSLNHAFFKGKPTSREISSQHPYAEGTLVDPHVITVDYNNLEEFESAVLEIIKVKVKPYLPYEYTCEGMLERLYAYIHYQDFCTPDVPVAPQNASEVPRRYLVRLPNSMAFGWPANMSGPLMWPPLSAMQLWVSEEGQSCTEQCQYRNLVCEPAFFSLINSKDVFQQLQIQCDQMEVEMNHVFPGFSSSKKNCFLQKEPLLFSCAGFKHKHQRLCPCRDFRAGQVALCTACL
ncbi:LOW QUALITY PROTEIN: alpha-1,6-mannosylglycoprotein 6-beta-N-acetylglucosaminyltransferase B [Erpetoichthys calabaricus]|uniref:LOW QUALITY PROTEIN: alpha-1,6-mannosylglycoprotein 6-beta-N-acetylglucosaminyltransferase B n=1 Tax=Erpetoichthys calabaricus TaxID=27687 RepID=UPI0022341C0B|nr:LOW QUALITY PROTEIN: alpha-1,6-mannosylglycoprotein 6-beta-N-acetylglucosaminyltransferase B [Erpetoichthys calabaricus]